MKNNYIIGILLSVSSIHAFAVQDQLQAAQQFVKKTESISIINKVSNILTKDDNESKSKYFEIKSDIRLGQKNEAVGLLQSQLELDVTNIYDASLQEIIKEGQKQWGLNSTGIIDENTWFAFYQQPLSWQKRVAQEAIAEWSHVIEKDSLTDSNKMIIVNIPSQTLMLYEKENGEYKYIMTSPVVVGNKRHQTPFDDISVISFKYNPNWTPTPNMLRRSLYKGGELNTQWLKSHGLVAINEEGEKVDFEDITSDMKLRFVQPPGDNNALGLLKFETNSKDNIYLHDTNEKNIFNFNTRVYSSGCIRVKDYMKLASLIANKPAQKIKDKINLKETVFEKVDKTPVYFTYAQVLYDVNGNPMYYADVYKKRNHANEQWQ